MRLLSTLALLLATAAALPTEPDTSELNSVEKRASCATEFPKGCASVCCKQAGGCSFLNCADSYCKYFNLNQPECVCKCHYG